MRLLTVQVQDFRCVEDSTEFSLVDVTCLVGKNESGKTALLKALYKLKPDNPTQEAFHPAKDYPRRKWRPDTPIPPSPPALTTTWKLEDADIAAIEQQVGTGVIADRVFTISKGYDNTKRYNIKIDEATLVKNLLTDNKLSREELKLSEVENTQALQRSLTELKELS